MSPMAHVLVVEDDRHIRDLVALHLGLEGLECTLVGDGHAGLAVAETPFDSSCWTSCAGLDGVTVCKALRRTTQTPARPVLMLTARGEESDKVLGLESGADDYWRSPSASASSSPACARCCGAAAAPPEAGDAGRGGRQAVTITARDRSGQAAGARLDNREIELTAHEFELLYLLAEQQGNRLQPRGAACSASGETTRT